MSASNLRYALRSLRKSPGFTWAAVASLALGIGATTAIYSVVDTVLLKPLPYPEPDRLVSVSVVFPAYKAEFLPGNAYTRWQQDNHVFTNFAALTFGVSSKVLQQGEPVEIGVDQVTANFFDTLHVLPRLGRTFQENEQQPQGPKAIILTDHLWKNKFHEQPDILGRPIVMDGKTYTVVGVLPASFIPLRGSPDAFIPLDADERIGMGIARLKDGVSVANAQAELETFFAEKRAAEPNRYNRGAHVSVVSLREHGVGKARLTLIVLLGAVFCLLLIACANVSSLLLARWSARLREIAIRTALGASRRQILAQLVIETGLLTACGTTAALFLVYGAQKAFLHLGGASIPRLNEMAFDLRIFAASLAVSLLTQILFGILPAFSVARTDVQPALQTAGRQGLSGGRQRFRACLVTGEISLSLLLLVGTSLLLETLWHLGNDHLGFQTDHVLSMNLSFQGTRFENANRRAFVKEVRDRLMRFPGTEEIAIAYDLPPQNYSVAERFSLPGRPQSSNDHVLVGPVSSGYFHVLRIPIIQGHVFADSEVSTLAIPAVINQAAARRYFPGENPVGRQFNQDKEGSYKIVVGVAEDTKNHDLDRPTEPAIYVPYDYPKSPRPLTFLIRTAGDPAQVSAAFQAELRSMDPYLFARILPLEHEIERLTSAPRFQGIVFASFTAISLVLTLVGIYGVLSFTVAVRTQEIGIRMALGAQRKRVLGMVLGNATAMILAGLALGLAASFELTRYLKVLLYGVGVTDLRTFALAAAGLGVAGILASLIPARRAASVDPIVALRCE